MSSATAPTGQPSAQDIVLLEGDCLTSLRGLTDASIDSVVTDPPYGLSREPDIAEVLRHWLAGDDYVHRGSGFMGKTWDSFVPGPAYWREVFRVLKPGGYAAVFAGTRTQDLMGIALRLAGFEIRDGLQWIYGVGFPKNLNVSKALNAGLRCQCSQPALLGSDDDRSNLSGVRGNLLAECEALGEGEDPGVLPAMQRGVPRSGVGDTRTQRPIGLDAGVGGLLPREDVRAEQSRVEGRGHSSQTPRELRERQVREMPDASAQHGPNGRLCDGTPAGDGRVDRPSTHSDRVRTPQGSRSAAQPANEPGALAGQPEPQAGGAWENCDRCGKPVVPDGLGTALKPAYEPIVLARKPLIGTVVENVLAHGTGGLNIDGCRIAHRTINGGNLADNPHLRGTKLRAAPVATAFGREGDETPLTSIAGRWPANILHDGSDEVEAAFAAFGIMKDGVAVQRNRDGQVHNNIYGSYKKPPKPDVGFGGGGSASRFFYCAKASKADRAGSKHPTVKPVALMRWLVRLVTPPGGTVLDPFAGSGTTGQAAHEEGFSAVLCEREAEFIADIRRRLGLPDLSIVAADSGGHVDIFDGLFGEVFAAPAEDIFA